MKKLLLAGVALAWAGTAEAAVTLQFRVTLGDPTFQGTPTTYFTDLYGLTPVLDVTATYFSDGILSANQSGSVSGTYEDGNVSLLINGINPMFLYFPDNSTISNVGATPSEGDIKIRSLGAGFLTTYGLYLPLNDSLPGPSFDTISQYSLVSGGTFSLSLYQAGTTIYNIKALESFVVSGEPLPSKWLPEPATWATLILGFGIAGSAVRLGRRAALA